MYNTLIKHGTTAAFIVGFLVSIFIIITTVKGVGPDVAPDNFEALGQVGAFKTAVLLAVVFLIVSVVAILLGGAYGLIANPKSAIYFVIGLAVLAILFFIFYSTSTAEKSGPLWTLAQQYDISDGTSKMISGGILLTIVLLGVSAVVMLLGELRNMFK